MKSVLQPFGEGLWIYDGPRVKMMTIPFTTRMTLVELEPEILWIHSPCGGDSTLWEAVDALGEVRFIVAPNKIHSLGIEPWRAQYPNAEIWVSPRFSERHPSVKYDHVLSTGSPNVWGGQVAAQCFLGSRFLDEVIFYHTRSKSLILTDLIQRHDASGESRFWRFIKKRAGVLGPSGGTSLDLRASFTDKDAAQASAEAILQWGFERVVIAHGICITKDARQIIENALQWALEPNP